jgi:phenylacetate-CoA ligase
MADYLIEHKKRLDSVRMIQYVGEHLSENAKRHIKNAFGEIEIKPSGYSSSDCGLMGYQCEECKPNEYHIPTEAQLIEIYDFENDRLCEEGETGEIIVTNLTKTSFPIIRYRVGDIGYIKKERCKCGDKNPILVLKGRAGEDFKLGGGYISMDEIDEILSDFVSVDGISANYSIEIEDMGNWLKLTIKIETSDIEASKKHINEIKKSLNKIPLLKQDENEAYVKRIIEFVPLGSLERSPITGKIKKLVDKRVNL